jgi:hypothetical protein
MFITMVIIAIVFTLATVYLLHCEIRSNLRIRIDSWFKHLEEDLNVCAINHQVLLTTNAWSDSNLEGFYLLPPHFHTEQLELAVDQWYYFNPLTGAFYIAKYHALNSLVHLPDFETMDFLTPAEQEDKRIELHNRLLANLVYSKSAVDDITINAIRNEVSEFKKTVLLHYGLERWVFYRSSVFHRTYKTR